MSGLWYALRHLTRDILSALIFAGLYAMTSNLILATVVSIGVGVVQVLVERWRGQPIHTMQWLTLGLVLVLGTMAIFLNDPGFMMIKPTIAYIAVGLVMLKPGWMLPYLPPKALESGTDIAFVFGYLWAALMFATAVGNVIAIRWGGMPTWAAYIAVFPLFSKLALFIVQYLVMRVRIGRRRRLTQSL